MTGEYIRSLVQIIGLCFPFYAVARVLWIKRWSVRLEWGKDVPDKRFYPGRELVLAVFVLFMTALLVLTFQRGYGFLFEEEAPLFQRVWRRIQNLEGINLVPFQTISTYFVHYGMDLFLVNIVGNIVMFLPWGFGLPLLWKRYQSMGRMWSRALLLPVLIEVVQLFVGRSVDVDDIILNFLGGFLGALLYFGLKKLFPGMGRMAR